jgi:hypothetical protein
MNKELLSKHASLKLQIELVPDSCWFSNVRSQVSVKHWDLIRHLVYKKAHNKCEICGGKGIKHPVECHEVWEYDEISHTQTLSKLQALCPLCHEVKHFGLAKMRGNGYRAQERFISINGIDIHEADDIIHAVWDQWRERGLSEWILDISLLKEYGIDTEEYINKK